MLTLTATAACGTSRSTRSAPCSNLKAVVDTNVAPGGSLQNYDPTAALLLFKATSDKLTVESRCNARLVNRVVTQHKRPDGGLEDIVAPIDYSKLTVILENGENNLELHTSAHCFYRIWDSRIENQIKNNPMIGVEPMRSLLKNMKTRYQLYRSMLTTPQTVVVYLPDGRPVSFEYKLQSTAMYQQFFKALDELKMQDIEETVGRELSKVSAVLDELVLLECNADAKLVTKLDDSDERNNVRNGFSLLSYISEQGSSVLFREIVRTRMLASGRHKLCFSQNDMVVAPIQLVAAATNEQKQALQGIEAAQRKDIEKFADAIAGRSQDKLLTHATAGANVPLPPAGVQACSFANTHPGYAFSDPLVQKLSNDFLPKWNFAEIDSPNYGPALRVLFPNLTISPSESALVRPVIELIMNRQKCSLSGKLFDETTRQCTGTDPQNTWLCPTSLETANVNHPTMQKSLQIANASPIHALRRMRNLSPLILTMPFAGLRDYVSAVCGRGGSAACDSESIAPRIAKILDSMTNTSVAVGDGNQQIGASADLNDFRIKSVDADGQFTCELRANPNIRFAGDVSGKLFERLTKDVELILKEGFSGDKETTFSKIHEFPNLGSRFLYIKCVSAGFQRLYGSFDTAVGLIQSIKFLNLSLVKSDLTQGAARSDLNNADMVQSGRPIGIPFPKLFFADSRLSESASELAARLLAGPHMQISYCRMFITGESYFCSNKLDTPSNPEALTADLQSVLAHLNFTTRIPDWMKEDERKKYGPLTFPAGNYSPDSARYFLSAGDSGTTASMFNLFPILMLSTVQDVPVSGGLAVIPSSGGQEVQSSRKGTCR